MKEQESKCLQKCAVDAFKSLRMQAQARQSDEITLEEINAEIALARVERKTKL